MQYDARRVHTVTLLITLLGAACCILQATAPFAGVFQGLLVQITFVAGALTYARSARWLLDPIQSLKSRLILHGNLVVLISVAVTLILDVVALRVLRPRPHWVPAAMAALGALLPVAGMWLGAAFVRLAAPAPPAGLTVADGIDDLLVLVRWAARVDSDTLFHLAGFTWLAPVNPRSHPWGFASLLGLGVGLTAFLAWFYSDGPPLNLRAGMIVVTIFVLGEFMATLTGFAALGPYLGLRPGPARRD